MCGIVGYSGFRDAGKLLPECLRKIEYRGYDSFGFAVLKNPRIVVQKKVGKVCSFKEKLPESHIGIAHTRWATHGKVTQKNAHPHLSCDKSIAIVHNGIIENFAKLREQLTAKGHRFESETDSEAIAHLTEELTKQGKSFEEAVRETCRQLKGTFALLFLNKENSKLIAAKKGSPLIIGLGKNEAFAASDMTAFIEFTKNALFLDDNELALIEKRKPISIENFCTKQKIEKKASRIEWSLKQAQKQGFKHFMLKEIFEQPRAAEQCLQGRVKHNKAVLPELQKIKEKLKQVNRIVLVACGTSWHACLTAEYVIEKLCKLPTEVEYASEFRYRNPIVDENCLLIVVSQSGETADTIAALKEAKRKKALAIAVCNVMGSTIARNSRAVIYTRAGPEIGVASTKAFTTQLIALTLLALYLAREKKTSKENELESIATALKKIPRQMQEALKQSHEVKKVASKYWDKQNALYLGRGPNYPIALEGALKLKEISYLHAEGMSAAEMKHGPIALIDSNMPAVFIAVKDNTYEKILANIQEVKARGGSIIAVANSEDREIKRLAEHVLFVPKTIELLQPMLCILPLQLLAYYIADKRGCDIDKPRNLAKSVTVE